MRLSGRGAPLAAVAISILALLVAVSSASYAAVTLAKNSVGTAQLKKNAVTSAKVKDGTLRVRDLRAGVLRSGPRGAQGPPGVQGIQGPPGPVDHYWAVVQANGTLVRSSTDTAVSASVVDPSGAYAVDFGTLITGCSFVGAIAMPSTSTQIGGAISLAVRGTNEEAVYVETTNFAGALTAKAFHLMVAC